MGLGAELCAIAAEAGVLDVPPVRVAMPDIPGIPVDDVLEDAVLPNRATIREEHLRMAVDALAEAARAHPSCNATFSWSGIAQHPDVVVDLDLGPSSPAGARGTITLVDYGKDGSDLAIPFVRPGQTAAVRIGAVRGGRAYVACAVDHRAVDGAEVGRFLATFKSALERRAAPEAVRAR